MEEGKKTKNCCFLFSQGTLSVEGRALYVQIARPVYIGPVNTMLAEKVALQVRATLEIQLSLRMH